LLNIFIDIYNVINNRYFNFSLNATATRRARPFGYISI